MLYLTSATVYTDVLQVKRLLQIISRSRGYFAIQFCAGHTHTHTPEVSGWDHCQSGIVLFE